MLMKYKYKEIKKLIVFAVTCGSKSTTVPLGYTPLPCPPKG